MIGGEKGNADGVKVLGPIMGSLISPDFLPCINWSGRSNKPGEKKSL